jgi:drug/metabolite transporter (DMT)-like permease
MIYLLISICCSVTVGIILKLARRYSINIQQAVTWNYLFAVGLSWFCFHPKLSDLSEIGFSAVYLSLGILLPVIFWTLATSIKYIGIAKTDIAQRLSLFIPILLSYFIFNENFGTVKIIGLAIGFAAIFFTLHKKSTEKDKRQLWMYPLLVFIGYGIIDTLFKKVAQITKIPYTTSLIFIFSLAFVISTLSLIYLYLHKNQKIKLINLIWGCALGFFNFFNILFYLKAHQAMSENPSTVFAAMNMGVIILGSAAGIYIFREKLSRVNYIGLLLALLSIIIITISRIYAI